MPRRLLQRCQPDSIAEFRSASHQRYNDGLSLAIQGRRTGAIYLWGYAIEMTLKAAYFSFIGKGVRDPITWSGDLLPAIRTARQQGVLWSRQRAGHNLLAWSEWLIVTRINYSMGYAADFQSEVYYQAQQAYQLWNETLRYHKNIAYLFEVQRMQESTEWFLVNYNFL